MVARGDWLGNVVAEHVGQESLANDAWETVPQSEPCNLGAVHVVVDKSKEENKEKKNSDLQTGCMKSDIKQLNTNFVLHWCVHNCTCLSMCLCIHCVFICTKHTYVCVYTKTTLPDTLTDQCDNFVNCLGSILCFLTSVWYRNVYRQWKKQYVKII